jgi:hypothetical protein
MPQKKVLTVLGSFAGKGCDRCKYCDICNTHVLPPSSLDLGLFTRERTVFTINELCYIYKNNMKSPKILYYHDPKTKKDS